MPQRLSGFDLVNIFEKFIQFSVKKGILNKKRVPTLRAQIR